ncbi:MAG TPA: hypothetical protein VHT73_15165 [Thermodesulfobacteriota bacterium]|nr:hypothetical protein [Thermodesulfobacteriota bacterium]
MAFQALLGTGGGVPKGIPSTTELWGVALPNPTAQRCWEDR